MFAQKYLSKQEKEPLLISPPQKGTKMIVVIPCFNEPDIAETLQSLASCTSPPFPVEVLVVINHSENEREEIKHYNRKSLLTIQKLIKEITPPNVTFYVIGPVELRKKWAGAGLARKTGMDEAVLRFNTLGKSDGIIVSLDADTWVEENYFIEIEKYFRENSAKVGATISFRHRTAGLPKKHLQGIQLYEKYLWYYKHAVQFTGYPYSMYTVGSAFAVTAEAYVKRGGMNRRQAGEDFYFLQHLAQLGPVGEINTTTVFPSARLSDRVPFGTGPMLKKWMEGTEDLRQTYNFESFVELKEFFNVREKFFKVGSERYHEIISKLPGAVSEFLKQDNFWQELRDVNNNCANQQTFQTRFFQKFNAFKILKYLNFVHERYYEKANLDEQIYQLNKNYLQ